MRRALPLVAAALVVVGAATAAGPPAPHWRPATYPVDGRASPVQVGTTISNGVPVFVVKLDHTRTRLALYPGTLEPPGASPRGPTQVPQGQRWRLLATFNGGFKANAGAGGFVVNGHVDEPLVNGMGTLVEYRDGSLGILLWQGRTSPRTLVLARQNLPPLVWNGKPSPQIDNIPRWGATLGGGTAVWRTAAGLTPSGDLVYVAGENQTPRSLAAALIGVGVVRAIELDINPQWPTFIAYGHRGARDPVAVVPNPQQSASRFLSPDQRDFFAVYTRAGGGPSVPFR